jgi:dTDP-4-dehydrorhamnose reductase
MRTLILGARGQLGRDLIRVYQHAGELRACSRQDVDITNEQQLFAAVDRFRPDLIINAAAYTDVEKAEQEMTQAFLVNEGGARNVATTAEYWGIPVVYFSTDFVFDGTKSQPYTPEDPIHPLNVYGRSKAAGEVATRKANPKHFIVRTAWLYGMGTRNFVHRILERAKRGEPLRVIQDEVGSPTYTLDLAEAVFALTRTREYGTYHITNAGVCSRYEFARAILNLAEINVPITACRADEFPSNAQRPRYSVLDCTATEKVIGYALRPWREALLDFFHRREKEQA